MRLKPQLDRIERMLQQLVAQRPRHQARLKFKDEPITALLDVIGRHTNGYPFTCKNIFQNLPPTQKAEIEDAMTRALGGPRATGRLIRFMQENDNQTFGRWTIRFHGIRGRTHEWKLEERE